MTYPAAPGSATALACGGARSLSTDLSAFPAQAFTLTAWARGNGTFIGFALDQASSFDATTTSLALRLDGSDLVVRLGQEEVHAPAAAQDRLADGEPHHLGVSVRQVPGANQATVRAYVNGVLAVQATVPMQNSQGGAMALPAAGVFLLGATPPEYEGASVNLFDGELTDVRVWTGELTAAEVYTDFNRTVVGNEPGLYAAWPLDGAHLDLASGAALDLGPNARHIAWTTLASRNPVFAERESFDAFPTADRCVQMWVRSGAGSGTLLSWGDVSGSDHPNSGGTPWQVLAGAVPADGRWHHLSVVGDSRAGTETTYVNGRSTGQRSADYAGTLAGQNLLLGAQRASDDDDQTFTGELRDVRLWSAVRSAEQIDLDARGLTPPPSAADPNCVAWWPLDAANGGTDASGRGRGLRIANNPNWAAPASLQTGGEPMAMELAGVDDEGLTALPGVPLGASDFSAEVWLRTTRGGPLLLGQRQRDGEAQLTLLVGADGVIELQTLPLAGSTTGTVALRAAGHAVNDDQWHHVALTCAHDAAGAAAATLWIDGEAVASSPCRAAFGEVPPTAAAGSQQALAFDAGLMLFSLAHAAAGHAGLQWPAGMQAFSGAVAEFRLWQRALVAGEIRGGMHHRLRGDEPALAGRWGFAHGSARDSSPHARHGVIAAGVAFSRDLVDLEPRDRPYLLVQTKLMEDYKFSDPTGPGAAPQACTTYRVVVQAVSADGQAMADVRLTVGLHAEPAGPAQAILLAHGAQGTQAFAIGNGGTQDFVTNVEGRVSFAIEAKALTAPVLAIRAPFMDSGHDLLVFPDRHAHAKLAQLNADALLGLSPAGPGQRPRTLLSDSAQRASAEALAHSVRKLMGAATESEPQSRNPVVRQRADRLVSPLPRTPSRRYENPYRSAAGYLPVSNLSAGHALAPGQQVIRQLVSMGDHWMIERQPDGSLSLQTDDSDGHGGGNGGTPAPNAAPQRRVRAIAEQLNPSFPDPVAALLVGAVRKRSLVTRAELDAAFDDRRRGLFDFFQSIVDAAKVVFHAVEVALDTAGQVIKAVVCYVVDAVGNAVAAVVDTVHKAADAVAGVFQKVGVAIGQVIDFVKDLFDWSDVVETQRVIEAHLSSVLPQLKTKLPSARAAMLHGIAQLKAQAHAALQALEPARLQDGTRLVQSSQAYAQPADVRAGYVQQLVADHGSDARIDTPLAAPSNLDSGALGALHQLGTTAPAGTRLSQGASGFDPAPAHASALDALLLRLLRLLENAADDAFDLAAQAVATLFAALAEVIDAMHALLMQRIDIPLLTTLYEKVVVPGSTLSGYSLAALVGAVPATLIYKLVNLSSEGPFHGVVPAPLAFAWPFDDQGNPVRSAASPAARGDTPTPAPTQAPADPWREFIYATWSLGGAFVGLLAVNSVLTMVQRVKPRSGPHWRRFVLAAGWLFQCAQLPLDSFRRLNAGDKPRSAAAESVIWIGQFAPLVVDSIISIRQDMQVPTPQEGPFERIRDGAMSLFGVAHFVGFVCLMGQELADGSPAAEAVPKMVANVASCVPEVLAIESRPPPQQLAVEGASWAVWLVISAVRYGIQMDREVRAVFDPR